VALVEKTPPGDCTHYGYVPGKTLLDVAHRVAGARGTQQWGLESVGDVDFGKAMAHVHEVIAQIEQDESPAEGIDVIDGWARFSSAGSIEVDGRALTADRFVLATGAHAAVPPTRGLDEGSYLDNKTLFDLAERPEHLLVMGGGAIGVELAGVLAARLTGHDGRGSDPDPHQGGAGGVRDHVDRAGAVRRRRPCWCRRAEGH
jgi:pyruvate/2-oxoglutarate dehydrogenase complex dihydrolipoamide dehydrogenase (E3) component